MSLSHGNQAIKIPTGKISKSERDEILGSKEVFVYSEMLNNCEDKLKKLSVTKNIDILEYNSLFNLQCKQYEDLYEAGVRKQFRKKYYNDQKKEFYMPSGEMYHPYNPYIQKYNGAYMRVYQEF